MLNVAKFVRVSILAGFVLATTPAGARTIRLHFAPGSYGAIANSTVTSHVFQRAFSLEARAGQTLILTFTGNGSMRGSVSCQGGGDGPYYGGGDSFVVPASGLCIINVGANTMAEDWTGGFTLAVLLTKPSAQ